MRPLPSLALLPALLLASLSPLRAVDDGAGYDTDSAALASSVANWGIGWGATGVTGWSYVGAIGGASGVYLGNGWVLTAAHIGAGTFILGGTSYSVVTGTAQEVGNTDLVLFQIASAPSLPSLTLATSAPSTSSSFSSGSGVVMIGYGGGSGESWGFNHVTSRNLSLTPENTTYVSTDFATALGTTAHGDSNAAYVVPGDSGGAGFIYNSATSSWQLAGILEAVDASNNSYLVQLSAYASTINAITATSAVPEPETWGLVLGALILLLLWRSGGRIPGAPRA